MSSIFQGLPNHLIFDIIRIESERQHVEKNYDKVVEQMNMITTYSEFCPSIRETMNGADDGLSVSEIWDWDEMRVMDDLRWLNELWWNEEKKRKENN